MDLDHDTGNNASSTPATPRRTRKVNPYKVYKETVIDPVFTNGQIGKCRDWIRKNAEPGFEFSIRKDFGTFQRVVVEKTRIIES